MRNSPIYLLSLGLTVVMTLAAFAFLITGLGALINGLGHAPLMSLMPWKTVILLAVVAVNCTLRSRLVVKRGLAEAAV